MGGTKFAGLVCPIHSLPWFEAPWLLRNLDLTDRVYVRHEKVLINLRLQPTRSASPRGAGEASTGSQLPEQS